MLANKTTLIVGAGASVPLGYPTGTGLRDMILAGAGIGGDLKDSQKQRQLHARFSRSMMPSIDAFLAEPENKDLCDYGVRCIAAALLPLEAKSKDNPPVWMQMVFNAIRGKATNDRQQQLKIVTFNYDLSIEHYLLHAFSGTYGLELEDALPLFRAAVQIVHVYGQLGDIRPFTGRNKGREYGGRFETWDVHEAVKSIKIIGRDPTNEAFNVAHAAIAEAEFLAILGFGFDETNVANLKLKELAGSKVIYSTGWDMGFGTRSLLRSTGLSKLYLGHRTEDVATFLHNSAFLQWANTPQALAQSMVNCALPGGGLQATVGSLPFF